MTAATRSLATALWGARFASGLLPQSYTTSRDTTTNFPAILSLHDERRDVRRARTRPLITDL